MIVTTEIYEDMPIFACFFKNCEGKIKKPSILIARMGYLILGYLGLLLGLNLGVVMTLGGSVISPILSFFLPVFIEFLIFRCFIPRFMILRTKMVKLYILLWMQLPSFGD